MYNEMAIGRKSVATVNKEARADCKFLGPVGGKKTLDHMFQLVGHRHSPEHRLVQWHCVSLQIHTVWKPQPSLGFRDSS